MKLRFLSRWARHKSTPNHAHHSLLLPQYLGSQASSSSHSQVSDIFPKLPNIRILFIARLLRPALRMFWMSCIYFAVELFLAIVLLESGWLLVHLLVIIRKTDAN